MPISHCATRLSNLEIASRVGDGDIRFRKAGGDESVLQLFSVRQYPRYFRLSGMNYLIGDPYQLALSMPCPFLITMGAVALDYESARTRAQMKAARATQSAGSYLAHFQPDLQERKRDWDMVLKTFDSGTDGGRHVPPGMLLSRGWRMPRAASIPYAPCGVRVASI